MLQYKPLGRQATVVIAGELDHFAAPQIRRMLEAVGHRTLRLKREGYGPLTLGDLKSGQWRYLTDSEIDALLKAAKE